MSAITPYICTRCRDGREAGGEIVRGEDAQGDGVRGEGVRSEGMRGGARFADAVLAERARRGAGPSHAVCGVRCLSQCTRPCTVALAGPGRFGYLFGDPSPERDAGAVLDALDLYASAPDGFMPRDRRPASLRAGILGRIPPLSSELGPSFLSYHPPSTLEGLPNAHLPSPCPIRLCRHGSCRGDDRRAAGGRD